MPSGSDKFLAETAEDSRLVDEESATHEEKVRRPVDVLSKTVDALPGLDIVAAPLGED